MLQYEQFKEYHKLHEYVLSCSKPSMDNYVFIDEVQMCEGFEKAVVSLHAMRKFDIYLTGSNAFLLSSDLATLFTGRTYEIEALPFSFAEFCKYFEPSDIRKALDEYLLCGGMPGSYVYKTERGRCSYLNREVLNALIVRDLVAKRAIKDQGLLDGLLDFMMDNIGNLTSMRKIAQSISKSSAPANHKTLSAYMEYLCNVFAFYRVGRYDVQGKRYLATEDKYYLADHAFRYARLGKKNMNTGRMIENIVAIELLRRKYELYAGVLYRKEIDFVAQKQSQKLYIQVADSISDEKTFQREVAPLLEIKDGYPKILIARTYQPYYTYEGIYVFDLADWLLGKVSFV